MFDENVDKVVTDTKQARGGLLNLGSSSKEQFFFSFSDRL